MANKQFRMGKKNGSISVPGALIYHTVLSKTNTFNFYRKKSLNKFFWGENIGFCSFLDKIQLQKTVKFKYLPNI